VGFATEVTRDAVDACYEAWGRAAQYTLAGGGAAMPCVVLIDFRDPAQSAEDSRPLAGQKTLSVRTGEVVVAPVPGAQFAVSGGATLTVCNRPVRPDPDGFEWEMWVE